MSKQVIPTVNLKVELDREKAVNRSVILEDSIEGVQFEHVVISRGSKTVDAVQKSNRIIYLFVSGTGNVLVGDEGYGVAAETILLPGATRDITIKAAANEALDYLKISVELGAQDLLDLEELPTENTEKVYCKQFKDCQPYTEKIKSPNTVSRTILSNKYIPRVAMGTVETKGPDAVVAHEHPMLEQVFLGLSNNNCTVYADDAEASFSENSVLHIPLGSTHSVSVAEGKVMYYVWMDFFLDKQGEEWLKTHKVTV